jgi:integrase
VYESRLSQLVALRRLYASTEQRDGLVFSTRSGQPHSDSNLLARFIKPAGKQAGVPWVSWHTLRRTHATLLSQSGTSPKDAQAQLGHAHIATTMDIYTQPTPAHQRKAVEKMAELVTIGDESSFWRSDSSQETVLLQ